MIHHEADTSITTVEADQKADQDKYFYNLTISYVISK